MPNCPEEELLPPVEFEDDGCNPETHASELQELYIALPNASDFVSVADPAEWATRLSQTAQVSGNEIRKMSGTGDKPAAQPVTVNLSKQRTKVLTRNHTVNFTVDNSAQVNYDAARSLQKMGRIKFWYEDRGSFIQGGNTGIVANMDINPVFGAGDEVVKFTIVLTWQNIQDPERIESPI